MSNKYYTPEFSDLYPGYECEILELHKEEFVPTGGGVEGCLDSLYRPHIIANRLSSNPEDYNFLRYIMLVENKSLRTPYLSKAQVQKELKGFEMTLGGSYIFTREGYYRPNWLNPAASTVRIYFNPNERWVKVEIKCVGYEVWDTIFECGVPSINEFRKIMKLLEI
jgi:hypothetical protein